MYIVLIILTLICAVLLICVVLVQKSKGGLSSSFAGSNQIMGVRRTNSFIEKLTWGLAGVICVLAVLSTFCMPKAIVGTSRVNAPAATEQTVPGNFNTPAPVKAPEAAPAAETEAPAATETPAAEAPATAE